MMVEFEEALNRINPYMDEAGRNALMRKYEELLNRPINDKLVTKLRDSIILTDWLGGSFAMTAGVIGLPLLAVYNTMHPAMALNYTPELYQSLGTEAVKQYFITLGETVGIGATTMVGTLYNAEKISNWVVQTATLHKRRNDMMTFIRSDLKTK